MVCVLIKMRGFYEGLSITLVALLINLSCQVFVVIERKKILDLNKRSSHPISAPMSRIASPLEKKKRPSPHSIGTLSRIVLIVNTLVEVVVSLILIMFAEINVYLFTGSIKMNTFYPRCFGWALLSFHLVHLYLYFDAAKKESDLKKIWLLTRAVFYLGSIFTVLIPIIIESSLINQINGQLFIYIVAIYFLVCGICCVLVFREDDVE